MIVASVLRTGGPYTLEYVRRLRDGVARHLPVPHRFTCLTDAETEGRVALQHDWPRWWGKIELFRPGLFPARSLVLYLDLDTVVVGDLSFLADYNGEGAVLADLYRSRDGMIGSGALLWRAGATWTQRVWEDFTRTPERIMQRHAARMDKYLLGHMAGLQRLQDLWPGRFVSYKKHVKGRGVPKDAAVICFHGKPRPADLLPGDSIRALWEGVA
jgi:hypothetical protein